MSRWEIKMSCYSLAELADLTGIQARTIRSYIEKGIVPAPERPGRHAYYVDDHLDRLRAIVALRRLDQLTLDEVRRKLLGLSREEIRALAREGNPEVYPAPDDGEPEQGLESYIRQAREELAGLSGTRNRNERPPTGVIRAMISAPRGGAFTEFEQRLSRDGGTQSQRLALPPLHEGSAGDALSPLSERVNEMPPQSKIGGLGSGHDLIMDHVLRLLFERVDREAAAVLPREEMIEELRPIIMEVLEELKIPLNRRGQFAFEKVLINEIKGHEPVPSQLEEASRSSRSPSIKVETQTRVEVTPNVDLIARGALSRRQMRLLEQAAAELRERLLGNTYDD